MNLLPDGSILDATADQLGEGKDVIVVHPSDKNYHRYRPEFSHDSMPITAGIQSLSKTILETTFPILIEIPYIEMATIMNGHKNWIRSVVIGAV